MTKPTPGSTWRHYKGGLYTVLDIVEHHDTRREYVVYLSHEKGSHNLRPLHGFVGDPDGWMTPARVDVLHDVARFVLVEDPDPKHDEVPPPYSGGG
jgi:hypothetical protein